MSLFETISNDMKVAMKARDQFLVNTLRLVMSQLKYAQIDSKEKLTPEQELDVLMNAAKKRKEAIEIYQKTDRTDLLETEQKELEIIKRYLPAPMSDAEISQIISDVVKNTGAAGMNDLGKVMGETMKILKGKADGKKIQEMVRQKLA
jgi:uncharacterized protein